MVRIRIYRIVSLLLCLILFLSSQISANSGLTKPVNVTDGISQMNAYIIDNYAKYVTDPKQLERVNKGILKDFLESRVNGNKVIVYPIQSVWEKHDTIAYDEATYNKYYKENPATPRYLGLAVNGSTLVPNMSHPIDSWTEGKTYDDYNWIKEPWGKPDGSIKGSKGQAVPKSTYVTIRDTKGVSQLPFDGLASAPFEDKIREGLKLSYYNGKSLWGPGCENITWSEYVHIIQVPTLFSPGLGIMFNQFPGGGLFYKSMTLPADNGINLTISNLQVDQNITA